MSARGRSENSRTSMSESPIPLNRQTVSFNLNATCYCKRLHSRGTFRLVVKFSSHFAFIIKTSSRTTPIVPRGQERPRISIERSRSRSENCCRRDVITDSESGLEDTSPTFQRVASSNSNCSPSILPCRTPSSSSPNGRSTPVSTPLSTVNARGSCCDHEKQFDALQRKLAALTEKIDNLQGSSNTVVPQRRNENLPRDMVVSIKDFVADFMRTRVSTMGSHFGCFFKLLGGGVESRYPIIDKHTPLR